jgi:IclR family acetate operon transcriptional repressor
MRVRNDVGLNQRCHRESSLQRDGELKLNQSVQRAAAILGAAASPPGGDTASGLARRAELPWATTVRLIRTLEHEGLLVRLPTSDRYVPGPRLFRLASVDASVTLVTGVAMPHLERLVRAIEETVNLTIVHQGGRLDVVEQLDPPRLMRPANYIGRWYPEHASSIGKLLLAEYDDERLRAVLPQPLRQFGPATVVDMDELRADLARIRKRGFSTAVDELEEGLAAVSVAIRGPDGELVAMVSASGPSSRFDETKREAALEHLRRTGVAIERSLATDRHGATVSADL